MKPLYLAMVLLSSGGMQALAADSLSPASFGGARDFAKILLAQGAPALQPSGQTTGPATTTPQVSEAADSLTRSEIEKLVAPIALYSDALLAQTLAASAYPLQIVQAARWRDQNREQAEKGDFTGLDAQKWDPAVKAIARFPTILKKMSDDIEWTSDLGAAYLEQPTEVADAIQDLRTRAEKSGALKDSPQQRVARRRAAERDVIVIETVEPDTVYVPVYDPLVVFGPTAPLQAIVFGPAVVLGAFALYNYWDWPAGRFYPPYWPGYPHWRPGLRPMAGLKPWRPNPTHFRPLVSARTSFAKKASLVRFNRATRATRRLSAHPAVVHDARPHIQRATRSTRFARPAARAMRPHRIVAPRYRAPRMSIPRYRAPMARGGLRRR